MLVTTSPTRFVMALAESQTFTPMLDTFAPVIEALHEKAENHPAYASLWDALPADARPELSHMMVEITGMLNDAFLAGLVCAHLPQEQ